MNRRRLAAALLACGALATPARADFPSTLHIGVLKFETANFGVSGAAASDLFSTALYRNFPGLSVANPTELEETISKEHLDPASAGADPKVSALLERLMGLDCIVTGSVIAIDKDPDGRGGTLMMSARLMKLSTRKILWADTRTAKITPPLLGGLWGPAPASGSVMTARLLELAVFQLVQDLGKRLPEEALSATDGRAAAGRRDAAKEGCLPPPFYESLPRDHDWYYGVGSDSDAGNAREAAVGNLAKQVNGNAVAEEGPRPKGGSLAGWEQDDYQRCDGISYILVRIKKERAQKSVNDSSIFGAALPKSSADDAPSGHALQMISRANAARTELLYADLLSPKKNCAARVCAGSPTRPEETVIAGALRKLDAGTITVTEAVQVSNIYLKHSEDAEERAFFDAVIYGKSPPPGPLADDLEQTREMIFPLAWSAALKRKDWLSFFKYCGDYLKTYPDGIFAATAKKNREIAAKVMMERNQETAVAME